MSSSSSSQSGNSSMNDVLLYAQSRLTRKQAVREIGEIVLQSNMKPRTVKHALQLIKAILPPDNTLPSTVQELFGAMLSSENDWRLAQYLIRHKQQPSFSGTSSSSSSLWNSNSSVSNTSSSTSFAPLPTSMILPTIDSSSESESDNENENASALSNSDSDTNSDDDDDDDDDEDEDDEDEDIDGNSFLARLGRLQQEESAPVSTVIQQPSTRIVTDDPPRPSVVTGNATILPTEQRSQIASNPLNRFAFLGSFKRQRSESSSSSEPCLYHDLQLTSEESDDDDDENSFYSLNNNPQSNSSNIKSRCFEMNGYDLLDGGRKRQRH